MQQVITLLIDSSTTHNCHSEKFPRPSKSKPYKKVRLKCQSVDKHHFISYFYLTLLIVISCCVKSAWCNRPPKFLIEGQTEIVLRLKEGDETPVGMIIFIAINVSYSIFILSKSCIFITCTQDH